MCLKRGNCCVDFFTKLGHTSRLGVTFVEPKWILNNDNKVLMITMYEQKIRYPNLCSSVQDHIIKLWLQLKSRFGFDTPSSKHKRKAFWYSREVLETSEELEHHLKKGDDRALCMIIWATFLYIFIAFEGKREIN